MSEKKKWLVYALYDVSSFVGEYEAETKEQAEEMANDNIDTGSLCHHCSKDFNFGGFIRCEIEESIQQDSTQQNNHTIESKRE